MKRLFFLFIIFGTIAAAQTFSSEPSEFHIGWAVGKYPPDSAGIQNAINDAYNARGGTVKPVVVFAPGIYDLGTAYIILKDSLNYRFDGNPKFTGSSANGIFTDNAIRVNVGFTGAYEIINNTYPTKLINLLNTQSSILSASESVVRKLVLDIGQFAGMAIDSIRTYSDIITEGTQEIIYNTFLEDFSIQRVAPYNIANPDGAAITISIPTASPSYTFFSVREFGRFHDGTDDTTLMYDKIISNGASSSGTTFKVRIEFVPGNINAYNLLPESDPDSGERYLLYIEFYR